MEKVLEARAYLRRLETERDLPNYTNIQSHLGSRWTQRDLLQVHKFDFGRIKLHETKVVHRVTVDRVEVDFFIICQDSRCDNWARRNNMAIG